MRITQEELVTIALKMISESMGCKPLGGFPLRIDIEEEEEQGLLGAIFVFDCCGDLKLRWTFFSRARVGNLPIICESVLSRYSESYELTEDDFLEILDEGRHVNLEAKEMVLYWPKVKQKR